MSFVRPTVSEARKISTNMLPNGPLIGIQLFCEDERDAQTNGADYRKLHRNLRETVRPESVRNHDASDVEGAKEQTQEQNRSRSGKRSAALDLLFAAAVGRDRGYNCVAQL